MNKANGVINAMLDSVVDVEGRGAPQGTVARAWLRGGVLAAKPAMVVNCSDASTVRPCRASDSTSLAVLTRAGPIGALGPTSTAKQSTLPMDKGFCVVYKHAFPDASDNGLYLHGHGEADHQIRQDSRGLQQPNEDLILPRPDSIENLGLANTEAPGPSAVDHIMSHAHDKDSAKSFRDVSGDRPGIKTQEPNQVSHQSRYSHHSLPRATGYCGTTSVTPLLVLTHT